MCGRYALSFEEIEELESFLYATNKGLLPPAPIREGGQEQSAFANFNAAPSQELPVAYSEEGKAVIAPMYWGFMGWEPKEGDKPLTPINARDDKILKSRLWKEPFLHQRCIIPANGFYEWTGSGKHKTPHYIYPKEGPFLGFAGLYSDLSPSGSGKSFTIITTSPNRLMESIHDRMPVILHREEFQDWLDPEQEDPKYLTDFLQPYPDDALQEHRVSKAVGNVRNNGPALIEKADLFG